MVHLSRATLLAALALAACATVPPSGPSVVATAGKDKSAAAFLQDDAECREVAARQIAAELPARPTEGGPAAAPVAGTPQQRYDASYAQCMCAKGDSIARRYVGLPVVTIGLLSSVGMGAAGHGSGNH
jgi:hypothetical protein